MKLRLAAVALLALGGVALWLVARRGPEAVPEPQPISSIPDRASNKLAKSSVVVPPEGNPEVTEETARAATNETLPSAAAPIPKAVSFAAIEEPPPGPDPDDSTVLPPQTALENMRSAIRQYTLRFGGNPVGDNAEITAALNGQNPRQVVFYNPDDGMRLNARGELVDNWGTPYFFHQLSRTQMEIRSAGSDKKMWTSDDLVLK
jgi:hypothetical protein